MRWLRSAGAILAGMVSGMALVAVLTLAATFLFFEGDFSAPPTPVYLAANILYSFGSGMLAGWVAERLGRGRPMAHAAGVALLILLLSSGGGGGGSGAAAGVPAWYGTALMVLMPIAALVGGWLHASHSGLRGGGAEGGALEQGAG